MEAKANRKWAIIIGIGLALSPIHSTYLTRLVTTDGEVGFFLPAFGTALWLMGALLFLVWSRQKIDWGDRVVFVPLLVIVAAIGLSGITADAWVAKFTPLLMGVSLFALYLVARVLGKDIFIALIPFAIIVTITVVVSGLLNPGQYTGGLITNYSASAGYLIFASLVYAGRWQWALLTIVAVGLFFIGALEAVFIVGVLVVVIIIRRDISIRFAIIVGVVVFLASLWAGLGYFIPLYEGNGNLGVLFSLLSGREALTTDTLQALTSGRWTVIVEALRDTSLIGHGFSLSTTGGGIVHNTPLIIMHQVGPVAAIAWVFVTSFCLIKTKWKYAWAVVIAMSIFDHYLWTQFLPWFFALVGVSTASNIKSDLIFRKRIES